MKKSLNVIEQKQTQDSLAVEVLVTFACRAICGPRQNRNHGRSGLKALRWRQPGLIC